MQKTWVRALGWEGPLDKEMATHSSILAWEISRTEEPGGLQSWGCKELATEVVIKRSSWDKPLIIPINDHSDVPNMTTHPDQLPFDLTFQVQILQHTNMPIHVWYHPLFLETGRIYARIPLNSVPYLIGKCLKEQNARKLCQQLPSIKSLADF